jgi:hypothetical protein
MAFKGLQVLTGALTAGCGITLLATAPKAKDDETVPTFQKIVPAIAGLAGALLLSGCAVISNHIDYIDLILKTPDLPFEKLYKNGLIDRLSLEELLGKFKEMMEGCRGPEPDRFIWISRDIDLPDLVRQGIATIADCQYETYEFGLSEVKPYYLGYLFPLKSCAFKNPALQREADRQEAAYQKLKAISDQYPHREYDFSGHMRDVEAWGEDPQREAHAIEQQNGWIQALEDLHTD